MQSSLIRWVGPLASRAAFAAGLLIAGAPAQTDVQEVQKLPSAASILDRHVEVTGGKKAHLKLTTRKMTGKLKVDMAGHRFAATVETQARAPGSSHMVLQSDLFSQVSVCDGEHAWQWNQGHEPGSGTTRLLEGPEESRLIERARFHASVNWRDDLENFETIGIAKVGNAPAYEVSVTTRGGVRYSRFYDVASGRLVKHDRPIESRQGQIETEVFLSDYREFDGVWLPMKVETVLSSPDFGKGTQTWTYTKVEHGVKIAPSLFDMPDEVKEQLVERQKQRAGKDKKTAGGARTR